MVKVPSIELGYKARRESLGSKTQNYSGPAWYYEKDPADRIQKVNRLNFEFPIKNLQTKYVGKLSWFFLTFAAPLDPLSGHVFETPAIVDCNFVFSVRRTWELFFAVDTRQEFFWY